MPIVRKSPQPIRKQVLKYLFFALAALIVSCAAAVYIAGGLLVAPEPRVVGPPPPEFPAQSITFESDSGSQISGWFIRGANPEAVIVLCHPIHASRLAMLNRAKFLWKAGFSVLLFDFQAQGESPGEHITVGYLESRDVRAAIAWARHEMPAAKVGALGVSMGAAAMLLGGTPIDVDAAVIEEVYPSIEEAVWCRVDQRIGPLASVVTPLLLMQLGPRLGISKEQLRPIDGIAKLHVPLLIIAGGADKHTPLDQSKRIFERANSPKEFWVVDGAAHIDLHKFAREEYEKRITAFFNERLFSRAN